MSITNYSELQSAVSNYLARSDLTSYIPDFIVGAESRIHQGGGEPFMTEALRIREMETSTSIGFTAGPTQSLPSNFLEFRRLYVSAQPNRKLEQLPPEEFWGSVPTNASAGGLAAFYTIEGSNITIGPSESITLNVVYYKQFDPVSTASAGGLTLLAKHPHVYVYGALMEAAPFLHNDERVQTWFSYYKSAVDGLNRTAVRGRWSGSTMAIRSDTGHP